MPAPVVAVKAEQAVEPAVEAKFKTEQSLEDVYQFVAERSKTLHQSEDAQIMKSKIVDMCFIKRVEADLQCEVWSFYKNFQKHW